MTHTQTTNTNRIALRAGKKGTRPTEVGALASVFEKSATELKQSKLLKCKQTLQIATFNVRTLNRIGQLPELIASAIRQDGNYTRMLRAILNKSWRQHPTRHQLYGHLPPITKTIQVRRTRHAGHCWRSRDELITDVLLWTPTHGRAKAGRPARTYIQQLCEDTGCCPEDLPRAMNDREEWRERVRDIRATSATWLWWL